MTPAERAEKISAKLFASHTRQEEANALIAAQIAEAELVECRKWREARMFCRSQEEINTTQAYENGFRAAREKAKEIAHPKGIGGDARYHQICEIIAQRIGEMEP